MVLVPQYFFSIGIWCNAFLTFTWYVSTVQFQVPPCEADLVTRGAQLSGRFPFDSTGLWVNLFVPSDIVFVDSGLFIQLFFWCWESMAEYMAVVVVVMGGGCGCWKQWKGVLTLQLMLMLMFMNQYHLECHRSSHSHEHWTLLFWCTSAPFKQPLNGLSGENAWNHG